jgi:cell division septum initiation protein DivIVA
MITLMVVAGIALLIAIGYLNHVAENSKVEKARAKVELGDRLRRCAEISETFPGQLMSPALKLLLARLELNVVQRMLSMEKSNAQLKQRIAELEEQVALGDRIPVNNPVSPIQTEAKAKDVRFLLEALHGQVTRAAHDGFLPTTEAKHWIREIRTILVSLHIEFFNNLGQAALAQDQPGQARLAFERGVQYLRNQPDPVTYQQQLAAMEKQLARANSMVLTNTAPSDDDDNALTEGLKADESESEWKKKVIYD